MGGMERLKTSLYEVLGVSRDAKLQDITRAYNRYRAELRSEAAAPDARREALMREAYEVLSDPQKREAYDASLRRGWSTMAATPRRRRGIAAVAGSGLAIAALAGWWLLHKPDPVVRSVEDLQPAIALGVSRLEVVDISGKVQLGGVAVAIAEGIAVAPCDDVAPGTQLRVLSGTRAHPARVAQSDGRGRCRLAVSGGAGFPLRATSAVPAVGDTVFVPLVSPRGETALRAGRVTRLEDSGGERIVVVDAAPSGIAAGTPLIDRDGRLVGFAWRDSVPRFTVAPMAWLEGGKMSSGRPSS